MEKGIESIDSSSMEWGRNYQNVLKQVFEKEKKDNSLSQDFDTWYDENLADLRLLCLDSTCRSMIGDGDIDAATEFIQKGLHLNEN